MIGKRWRPWGWGKEDIPRAFWQVDPADSHTLRPHCSPQAGQLGSRRFMGLLSPGNPSAHARGPKGSVVPPWSKAPGVLEGEGFSPTGDLLLSVLVLLSSSSVLGAPEDEGTWSACVCVMAGWAGRGIQRPALAGGCCGRGWGLGDGSCGFSVGGWQHEGHWGKLGRPKDSTGSPPAVAPHTGVPWGGPCLGRPRGGPSYAPYSRPREQFPHLLGSRS